jgi:hypothetical protein
VTAIEWVATLRRRWYVMAFVILCTLIAALAVKHRPITYEQCEGLYLSGPPAVSNVYLDTNPSLAMVTGIVTETMTTQAMQQQLQSSGVTADYSVIQTNTGEVRQPQYNSPTLEICTTSRNPQAVLSGLSKVASQFRAELRSIQVAQHAKPTSMIVANTLAPSILIPILGKPSQAYLGVLLIGLISAVSITLWTDRPLRRLDRWWAVRRQAR